MRRRAFIRKAGIFTAMSAVSGIGWAQSQSLKMVLRGAQAFYQDRWQTPDIGIDEKGRLVFGEAGTLEAGEVMTFKDKIVSPGFIDILTDNTANPERTYTIVEQYKITDGVTTALQMHGGSGNTASYYHTFGSKPHAVNYGVSTAVMRVRYSASTLAARKKKVEQCLQEGSLGVSHSIEYQPTPYGEVLEYAKLAARYDRPLFLHLRYSSEGQELEGVDEAIRLAKESGVRVHIDHLHSTGGTFHMAEALEKIRHARAQGLEITCCVYPYSFWATYLHSTRFDEGWQQRYGLTYNDLQLVGTGERLTKESFTKYRLLKKLVAVPEGTMPLDKTVDLALREEFCLIGSDGGIESAAHANSHPRGAGCFATALARAKSLNIPMEKMLAKMTILPQKLLRPALDNRGILATGAAADLVVFDPATVNGRASVVNPNQTSAGIDMVVVNGKIAYRGGRLENKNGVAIRR